MKHVTTITRVDDRDSELAWEQYVGAHPKATIYHHIAWCRIFSQGFGYKYQLLLAWRDGQVVGAVPLYRVPSFFGKPRLVAVPFRDRGGMLWNDIETFRALVAVVYDEKKNLGRGAWVELKSLEPYPTTLVRSENMTRYDYWVRSTVNLRASHVNNFLLE